MKLLRSTEKTIAKKDFGEIWSAKLVRAVLIAFPLILVFLLPAFYLVLIYLAPVDNAAGITEMLRLLPGDLKDVSSRQGMFYILTNMISPMLFLMVPVLCSGMITSCCFAGERERGTLDTLLLTPVPVRRIFRAKALGCMLLSFIATAVSFIVFAIVASVGDIMLKMPFFFNWIWLVCLFLLAPALAALGVLFVAFTGGRAKSCMESFLLSSYLVLPIVCLFLLPFTGLYVVSATVLLCAALVVAAADVVLWFVAARAFRLEKLVKNA